MARRTELEAGAPGALAEYYRWFAEAREGDELVYHRGDLAFDRDPVNRPGSTENEVVLAGGIDALATRVSKESERGFLVLSQRRMGENDFEYRATRRWTANERHYLSRKVHDVALIPT